MSESEPAVGRGEVWIEKYRPRTLDDVVGQESITDRLESYVERDDLPHLLFSGGAGIGKCVTGGTPVPTNRGVERIEDVVGEVEGFAEPDDDLQVLTLDDDTFRYARPSHVFAKRTDERLTVRTRDGAALSVTPEHKLLVVSADGLAWRPAEDIEAGDRIVRPLRAPLPEGDGTLDWIGAMDGERTLVHVTDAFAARHGIPAEENHVGKKKAVVGGLRRGEDEPTIAAETDTPTKTVQAYRRQVVGSDLDEPSTVCSLGYLRDLDVPRSELRRHVTAIQYVTTTNNRSEPIAPPWSVTPALAAFVGLAVSEARLGDGRITFYNTDRTLLERFERTARECFDVEPTEGEQGGVPYREIQTRTLTHLLESCFDVFDAATGGEGIGSTIVRADEESRAAFVRAVFDAEGHVTEHGIVELTQKNERLITLLSYLLAGVGIPSRRKTERKAATNGSGQEREYHTLYVSGARNLAKFEDSIGFTLERKADRLERNAGRESNPNHDTIPVQNAVDELCEALCLPKDDLRTDSLNPNTPGRENYLEDVERVLSAATERIETAQQVLEELDRLAPRIERISGVPAAWVGERGTLNPIETRRAVAGTTGIRADRLLEYADGRRTPYGRRAGELLVDLDATDERPQTGAIQASLRDAIESLGVPYEHLAEGTHLRGPDVINLLRCDDHDLASLSHFGTVADRLRTVASGMLSTGVLESLRTLHRIASGDFYYDTVDTVERADGEETVYDLTVPGTRNYVAGAVPTVMHNTTCAVAVARELYGEDWEEHFLELNASDERGIDVVRDRIKNFARSSFGGVEYRIIFLDEADALTSDAQSALRRTMEQFSHNTRFILSCNYSSQIIDPIQSRCAVFRFSPLPDDAVAERIREIASIEDIEYTEDGIDALVYAADGDMRKAINALQAAAVLGETVDEDAVYTITSTARPEEIEAMVTEALDGDFTAARSILDDLLTDMGLAGGDVIDQLHRSVWEFDLDDEAAVRLLDRIGEADYRITAGANERVQLEALLAAIALEGEE